MYNLYVSIFFAWISEKLEDRCWSQDIDNKWCWVECLDVDRDFLSEDFTFEVQISPNDRNFSKVETTGRVCRAFNSANQIAFKKLVKSSTDYYDYPVYLIIKHVDYPALGTSRISIPVSKLTFENFQKIIEKVKLSAVYK